MANAVWGIGGACALAVAAGWNAVGLREEVNPSHAVAGLNAHQTNASASLLGQFRTSTSSWLWLRTDLYLHNGVELRPLSESEKQVGKKGVGSSDAELGAAMDDANVVTSIPSPDRDFRGWLGDLERETSTYRDMHQHTHNSPKQSIPLFRLMTWIDPNFIDGWTAGSTVIAQDRTEESTQKALGFLSDGLKANPSNVSVLKEIGFLYITRRRDLATAVEYLERARESGLARYKNLLVEERDDMTDTYRWLALCYRDLGQRAKMDEVLDQGHKLFEKDPVIEMLRNHAPLIYTEHGQKLWGQKRAAQAKEEAEHGPAHREGHFEGDGHDHGHDH